MLLRKSLELQQITVTSEDAAPESKPLVKEIEENAHQLFTCETAQYFLLQEVLPRWEKFIAEAAKLLKGGEGSEVLASESAPSDFVANNFPFNSFITGFTNPPKDLIKRIFPVS